MRTSGGWWSCQQAELVHARVRSEATLTILNQGGAPIPGAGERALIPTLLSLAAPLAAASDQTSRNGQTGQTGGQTGGGTDLAAGGGAAASRASDLAAREDAAAVLAALYEVDTSGALLPLVPDAVSSLLLASLELSDTTVYEP